MSNISIVLKPLVLKYLMMMTASIQCLVCKHVIMKTQVVMMIVTSTRNLPKHPQRCNGKFQLTMQMGRNLHARRFAKDEQNVIGSV